MGEFFSAMVEYCSLENPRIMEYFASSHLGGWAIMKHKIKFEVDNEEQDSKYDPWHDHSSCLWLYFC